MDWFAKILKTACSLWSLHWRPNFTSTYCGRGLLRDCEIFANLRLQLQWLSHCSHAELVTEANKRKCIQVNHTTSWFIFWDLFHSPRPSPPITEYTIQCKCIQRTYVLQNKNIFSTSKNKIPICDDWRIQLMTDWILFFELVTTLSQLSAPPTPSHWQLEIMCLSFSFIF